MQAILDYQEGNYAITHVIITERQRQMTQRQRGEDSVASEVEIGVMEPPAKQ